MYNFAHPYGTFVHIFWQINDYDDDYKKYIKNYKISKTFKF